MSKSQRIKELESKLKEAEQAYRYELIRNEALSDAILYACFTKKIDTEAQIFIYKTEQGIFESVRKAGGLDKI